MVSAKAFSPGHITGFFIIRDEVDDPLYKGSLGAGFSITGGVSSEVQLSTTAEARKSGIRSLWECPMYRNGKRDKELEVSKKLIEIFEAEGAFLKPGGEGLTPLRIDHRVAIPEGCGFGSSGAGALSLSLALNQALGKPYTEQEAAAIAHRAEIACKTGLGTVIGEFYGGFEIRTAAGAPGHGRIESIPLEKELFLLFLVFTRIPTSTQLSNPETRETINSVGEALLAQIRKDPTIDTFFSLSRSFSNSLGLITPEVERNFARFDREGIPSAMLMFGNGLYGVYPTREAAEKALHTLRKLEPEAQLFLSSPSRSGGAIINE
jgi:pantoate kinase